MDAVAQQTTNVWHIGQAARRRRREMGITQAECAEKAAVSVGWLSAFENGRPGCSFGMAMEILALLGLSLSVCWPDDATAPPPHVVVEHAR